MTVLVLLTLSIILILAFFTLAQSEHRAASHYNNGVSAQMLSESAVNLVIGQIREATEEKDRLWISQPGGLRQYDDSGLFAKGFKLYSDDQMVVSEDEFAFAFDDFGELNKWREDDAIWVDLNEPVIRGELAHFPIVDPLAKTKRGVEGFDFETENVPSGDLESHLRKIESTSLPMPVKWLYVKSDGTMGTLDKNGNFILPAGADDSGDSGRSYSSPGSAANPIVGRIAFWADDETAKVNINTASEPVFWDTPRVAGGGVVTRGRLWEMAAPGTQFDDRKYGWSQPTYTEFQRFPGHPAQTALSPVLFPNVDLLLPEHYETIYDLVPRIEWGGSEAGERAYLDVEPLILDKNYLYPSVDEFVMSMNRDEEGVVTDWRVENTFDVEKDDVDKVPANELVEQSRFFLTANSRAPEINVFNLPRVSIWPTSVERETSKGLHRTPYDELLRFCSRTGKAGEDESIYYFQRKNADSPTEDWEDIPRNQEVFKYLQNLTSRKIPGYGGRFDAKFGDDRDQILTEIFDYIRCTNLYDENLDRHEYSFNDWMNLGKQSQFTDGRRPQPKVDPGDDGKERINQPEGSYPGHGQVVPIEIEALETRGFGRFLTVSEAGIMFICNADAGGEDPNNPGEPKHPKGVLGSNAFGSGTGQNAALPRELEWRKEERCIQAALLFELFTPSQGWTPLHEDMTMQVEIVEPFKVNGEVVDFQLNDEDVWQSGGGSRIRNVGRFSSNSIAGGTSGFWSVAGNRRIPARGNLQDDRGVNGNPKDRTDQGRMAYPFISVPLIIDKENPEMNFEGGEIIIRLYSGNFHSPEKPELSDLLLAQTLTIQFADAELPQPALMKKWGGGLSKDAYGNYIYTLPRPRGRNGKLGSRGAGIFFPSYWWVFNNDGIKVGDPAQGHRNLYNWNTSKSSPEMETISFSRAGRMRRFHSPGMTILDYGNQGSDVVRTMVLRHSDYRHLSAKKEVPKEWFIPHAGYDESKDFVLHSFTGFNSAVVPGETRNAPPLVPALRGSKNPNRYQSNRKPDFPKTEEGLEYAIHGDFDNGVSVMKDGAYINKPDEGNGLQKKILIKERDAGTFRSNRYRWTVPYYGVGATQQAMIGASYFSPNRLVPSPAMFGSLSTGVKRELPWQTLLFRPQKGHPGDADPPTGDKRGNVYPPDHLLLDLFWMPVVEPYAISEPFSTAGKINLNYQILPFSHITRSTGVRAVMKSEWMLAVPNGLASQYKRGTLPQRVHVRHPINLDETLKQFEEKFDAGRAYKTASEICDVHLIPQTNRDSSIKKRGASAIGSKTPPTLDAMRNDFWAKHALTGDNSRERPYANLYSRLTTKSNTFRVHFRCQTIAQGRGSSPDKFDPSRDSPTAECRGSTLIERYLEANEESIPDYATDISESDKNLQEFYKFRVVNSRRFTP